MSAAATYRNGLFGVGSKIHALNGGGKTTAINILTGFPFPDRQRLNPNVEAILNFELGLSRGAMKATIP